MSSAVHASSSRVAPLKVTHVHTIFADFHYPTPMSVGDRAKIESTFKLRVNDNRYFEFVVVKTCEENVSVIVERHVEDQTSNVGSVEEDASEKDGGCFLRLYISVIGVTEKPKSAVLRSTDDFASVQFKEASFFRLGLNITNFVYIIKCVFRRIETTVISNESTRKEALMLHGYLSNKAKKANDEDRKKVTFILKLTKLNDLLTGRKTLFYLAAWTVIGRAYDYSEELARYFDAWGSSKPEPPPSVNLGLILGYLYTGDKVSITTRQCEIIYRFSLLEGLMFLKQLCTAYMIENINDDLVIGALQLAVTAEDAVLFDAASHYFLRNKDRIFTSDRWKRLSHGKAYTPRSITHRFVLRNLTDNTGFPPAMEDETGEPY